MLYKDRPVASTPTPTREPESSAPDPRRAAAMRRRSVQRKAQNETPKADKPDKADHALEAAGSDAGEKVAPHIQRKVEGATGADLSGVRVHTGTASAEAAQSVEAKAYTVGQDVHFNAGQYRPGSAEGDKLIAHELAHTVQQSSGKGPKGPQYKLESPEGGDGDSHEDHADQVAEQVTEGQGDKKKADGADPVVAKLELNVDVQSADPTHLGVADLAQMHVGHAWISMQYLDPKSVPDNLAAPTQGMLKTGGTAMGLWPLIHRASDWPGGKPSADIKQRTDKGQTPGAGRDADPKSKGASLNPLHSFVPGRVEEPDTAHAANGSQAFELTQKQVDALMSYVDGKRSANYSLFQFNCVHFATQAVNASGHSAPSATQYGIVMPNGLYASFAEMKKEGNDDVSLSPQKKDEKKHATALR